MNFQSKITIRHHKVKLVLEPYYDFILDSFFDSSSNSFPIPMKKHIGTRKEDAQRIFVVLKKSFLVPTLRDREGFPRKGCLWQGWVLPMNARQETMKHRRK
jgi:hypothetical protein